MIEAIRRILHKIPVNIESIAIHRDTKVDGSKSPYLEREKTNYTVQ